MGFTREHKAVSGVRFERPSKTEAHQMRDCDINRLVNRLVGGDTTVLRTGGVYADVSEMPLDLQSALNKQITGRRAYEALPDKVKQRYPNAEEFYRAFNDPNSRQTFDELGLLRKPEVAPAPVKVEVVNSQVEDPNAPKA